MGLQFFQNCHRSDRPVQDIDFVARLHPAVVACLVPHTVCVRWCVCVCVCVCVIFLIENGEEQEEEMRVNWEKW